MSLADALQHGYTNFGRGFSGTPLVHFIHKRCINLPHGPKRTDA